jgi:hypothetical protein
MADVRLDLPGGEPIDRFVFVLDEKKEELLGLEIPFLRASLAKN